jgi:hypothetical protein
VLPYVDAEERNAPLGEGVVLVGGGLDEELLVGAEGEPAPA